jgi:hypothetical protein
MEGSGFGRWVMCGRESSCGAGVVGALDPALALLARVVDSSLTTATSPVT